MKKVLTFFLALAASAGTVFAQSGTCGDNLTWTLSGGTLTISGTGDMTDWKGSSNVPWSDISGSITSIVIENGVTSIGDYAFAWLGNLTNITLPNGLEKIGDCALFVCSSLTSIDIPNSVTSIGRQALGDCLSLTSITLPNSVKSIGNFAFENCNGLKSLTIPRNVTEIGWGITSACLLLTSIQVESGNTKYDSRNNCNAIIETATKTLIAGCKNTIIPNSVTSIGMYAFNKCYFLTSITIPNSVTKIETDAFENCPELTSIQVESGNTTYDSRDNCNAIIETASNKLIVGCKNTFIPSTVTSIGTRAFLYCDFTSITIPKDVTYIGIMAFYDCKKLTSIICKAATPPTCNNDCFRGVNMDIPVYVPEGSLAAYQGEKPWFDFTNLKTYSVLASGTCGPELTWELIDSVLTISGTGFMYDYELVPEDKFPWADYRSYIKSIVIESGVTSISTEAFRECKNLTEVRFPSSLKKIGLGAFGYCTALTTVTIPEGVEEIGGGAFQGCTGIVALNIPNSVTDIFTTAFSGVININYNGTATGSPWGARFKNAYTEGLLVYANESKKTLYACSPTVKGEVYIASTATDIAAAAFSGCENLTGVNLPNGLPHIEDYLFYGCKSLSSINIPASVQTIGEDAFYGCKGLTEIYCEPTTPPNWTGGANTFKDVNKAIPLYVPAAASNAYKNHTNWMTFTNIQDIPFETVSGTCGANGDNLKWTLYSHWGMLYIEGSGDMADYTTDEPAPWAPYKKYIKDIAMDNWVTSIGNRAFYDCDSVIWIENYDISNELTRIGDYAFYGCDNLRYIYIPNSLTSIGNYAFNLCKSLEDMWLPDGLTNLGSNVFRGCSNLTYVNLSENITSIKLRSFQDCAKLSAVTIPAHVATIVDRAFYNCSGLEYIICEATYPPYCGASDCFYNVNKNIPLYVPYGSKAAYQAANVWKEFTNIQEMTPTAIDQIDSSSLQGGDRGRLIIRNGQLFILRDGKVYTVTGQVVQ